MFHASMANDEIQNVYVVSNIKSFSIFVSIIFIPVVSERKSEFYLDQNAR